MYYCHRQKSSNKRKQFTPRPAIRTGGSNGPVLSPRRVESQIRLVSKESPCSGRIAPPTPDSPAASKQCQPSPSQRRIPSRKRERRPCYASLGECPADVSTANGHDCRMKQHSFGPYVAASHQPKFSSRRI